MGDVGTWGMPTLWDRRAQLLCRIPAPVWLPLPLGLHPRPQFSQGGLKAPPLLSAPLSAGSPPPFAGCRAGGAAFGWHGKAAPEQELLGKIPLLRFYGLRAPRGAGGPSAAPRDVSSVEDPLLPAAAGADPEQGPPEKLTQPGAFRCGAVSSHMTCGPGSAGSCLLPRRQHPHPRRGLGVAGRMASPRPPARLGPRLGKHSENCFL